MPWNLPGSATSGNPIPAAWGNNVNTDLTILQTNVGLLGTTAAQVGTAPAATTPAFSIQVGSSVVTASGGNASVTFPATFPNGLVTVVAVNGDASAGTDNLLNMSTSGLSTSAFSVFVVTASSNVGYSGSLRINWIAIGF